VGTEYFAGLVSLERMAGLASRVFLLVEAKLLVVELAGEVLVADDDRSRVLDLKVLVDSALLFAPILVMSVVRLRANDPVAGKLSVTVFVTGLASRVRVREYDERLEMLSVAVFVAGLASLALALDSKLVLDGKLSVAVFVAGLGSRVLDTVVLADDGLVSLVLSRLADRLARPYRVVNVTGGADSFFVLAAVFDLASSVESTSLFELYLASIMAERLMGFGFSASLGSTLSNLAISCTLSFDLSRISLAFVRDGRSFSLSLWRFEKRLT
jgi:hypothetical protein